LGGGGGEGGSILFKGLLAPVRSEAASTSAGGRGDVYVIRKVLKNVLRKKGEPYSTSFTEILSGRRK